MIGDDFYWTDRVPVLDLPFSARHDAVRMVAFLRPALCQRRQCTTADQIDILNPLAHAVQDLSLIARGSFS